MEGLKLAHPSGHPDNVTDLAQHLGQPGQLELDSDSEAANVAQGIHLNNQYEKQFQHSYIFTIPHCAQGKTW